MPRKCPHCYKEIIGKPISKLPLYIETGEYEFLGTSFHRKFNWEALRWRNINLKNLIIGDWINFIVIFSILLVAWSYTHDSAAYREIYNNPCDYVRKNIDACISFEEQNTPVYINQDLSIILIPLEEEVEK